MRLCSFTCLAIVAALFAARAYAQQPPPRFIEIPADTLEDKIRGGMLAQVIGNLNGLPHEFKYIEEPGHVDHFTPSLPKGAYTDDDTDIEWVYLSAIARTRNNLLPNSDIAALWKRHINRRIFAANRYARDLMDLGIDPPWTGNVGLNPWSEFNISGQFVCESFGLMAPAMPQTAAHLGTHYTHVSIDGEPAQATQLFTTMIATAFVESDMNKILDAGEKAVDPRSQIADVVATVRRFCRENPNDWKRTRLAIKERWQKQGGIVRERNGYELNTACVIAALIYGHNNFTDTLRTAFNFGWDADCDAATAATIVGVIKGRRWMSEQHWNIKDVYRNTTRDVMPNDETLTGLENLCIEAARITIQKNGGDRTGEPPGLSRRDQPAGSLGKNDAAHVVPLHLYRIRAEQPANVEPLVTLDEQRSRVRREFAPQLEHDLAIAGVGRARAAYIALSIGASDRLKRDQPAAWSAAVAELQDQYPHVVRNLFHAPKPGGDDLRRAAERAGLHEPTNVKLSERPLED